MIEGLYISHPGPASLLGSQESKLFTREDHMLKLSELGRRRTTVRPPRRSQTTHEYQLPAPLPADAATTTVIIHQSAAPRAALEDPATGAANGSLPRDAQLPPPPPSPPSPPAAEQEAAPAPRRPKMAPPRRSYSVMDYEPAPPPPPPSAALTLPELPPELHMAIFDFLDPIDSTCLGLTSKHFYSIHRRMHGTVSLSTRRDGPNDMERTWYLANRNINLAAANGLGATTTNTLGHDELVAFRVRGHGLCRKCGIFRCELHQHLREWMGDGYEYCAVREKFGPTAPEGAKPSCYRSKPNNPHQCGRHRVRKNKEASS